MTIEMTPLLEELDFPTPDLTEPWEPTAAEVTAFNDWFVAETAYQTALSEWLIAEERYEAGRYQKLVVEYMELSLSTTDRCYCSPSRGMMFDPYRYDIYHGGGGGGRGYAMMSAELEIQIDYLKKQADAERVAAAAYAADRRSTRRGLIFW